MEPNVSALKDYAGKFTNQLIAKFFRDLADQKITVMTNIKGRTWFPKLAIGKGLKPYTGQYVPDTLLNYTKRFLDVDMFQFDIPPIDSRQWHNTWFTETTDKNSQYYGMPFENFTWAKILESLQEEFIPAIKDGIQGGNNSNKALNIFNGFGKHITDLKAAGKASISTGAIDGSNAIEVFEGVYSQAMEIYPAMRRFELPMYISHATAELYVDNYRVRFDKDPDNWGDEAKPTYLKKFKGKCKLEPVDWMDGQEGIILTPKANLIMGTNSLSDMNKIKMIDDVYHVKGGITGVMGTVIPDDEALFFTEHF